jgi:hypothetical protein
MPNDGINKGIKNDDPKPESSKNSLKTDDPGRSPLRIAQDGWSNRQRARREQQVEKVFGPLGCAVAQTRRNAGGLSAEAKNRRIKSDAPWIA